MLLFQRISFRLFCSKFHLIVFLSSFTRGIWKVLSMVQYFSNWLTNPFLLGIILNSYPCSLWHVQDISLKYIYCLAIGKRKYSMKLIISLFQKWMDGWVRVLRPFNSISVISRRWKGEHERLCAMKRRLGSGRISSPAGFEPATPWSEVGSANRSATRTLLFQKWCITFTLMEETSFFYMHATGYHMTCNKKIITTSFKTHGKAFIMWQKPAWHIAYFLKYTSGSYLAFFHVWFLINHSLCAL